VHFFLAAATMWLVLVASQGSAVLRRWGTTVTLARTPVRGTIDSEGLYRYSAMARTLGAAALVAAIATPVLLPQLPPKFFLSGLGRSSSATGTGTRTGAGGFSLSIDLAADLNEQSTAPVPSVHDRRLVAAAATSRGHVFLPIPARRMATLR